MTATFFAPAVPAGVVAVIEVELFTPTFEAAVPPMVTVAPVTKLVPVIVTLVPPASGPEAGDMFKILGTAAEVDGNTAVTTPELAGLVAVAPATVKKF